MYKIEHKVMHWSDWKKKSNKLPEMLQHTQRTFHPFLLQGVKFQLNIIYYKEYCMVLWHITSDPNSNRKNNESKYQKYNWSCPCKFRSNARYLREKFSFTLLIFRYLTYTKLHIFKVFILRFKWLTFLQWGHLANALLRVLKRNVSWQWAHVTLHIPGTLGTGAGAGGDGARFMILLQFGLRHSTNMYLE